MSLIFWPNFGPRVAILQQRLVTKTCEHLLLMLKSHWSEHLSHVEVGVQKPQAA
jgi:hypothetical protein